MFLNRGEREGDVYIYLYFSSLFVLRLFVHDSYYASLSLLDTLPLYSRVMPYGHMVSSREVHPLAHEQPCLRHGHVDDKVWSVSGDGFRHIPWHICI